MTQLPAKLSAVPGITVGHTTIEAHGTGCTVVLAPEAGMRAAVCLRGRATGTRELDVMDPRHLVERIDAILFTGGSALGLGAADGVMRRASASLPVWASAWSCTRSRSALVAITASVVLRFRRAASPNGAPPSARKRRLSTLPAMISPRPFLTSPTALTITSAETMTSPKRAAHDLLAQKLRAERTQAHYMGHGGGVPALCEHGH